MILKLVDMTSPWRVDKVAQLFSHSAREQLAVRGQLAVVEKQRDIWRGENGKPGGKG